MNCLRRVAPVAVALFVAIWALSCPASTQAETVTALWARPIDDPESRADVVVIDAERAYLSGRLSDTPPYNSVRTLALDRVTGAEDWSDEQFPARESPFSPWQYESASLFAQRLAAAGALAALDPQSGEVGPSQAFVELYDTPTGNPRCTYRGGPDSSFFGVALSLQRIALGGSDGGVFHDHVRGHDWHCATVWTDDFTAAAYSPSGSEALAVATLHQGRPAFLGFTRPTRVTGAADRTVVAGHNTASNGQEVWMVRAYRTLNGTILWTDSVAGPGNPNISPANEASAVATSSGRAFVAGRLRPSVVTDGLGLPRAALRAYNVASGAILWTARDDHAAYRSSEYYAVAATPKVVVAVGRAASKLFFGDDDWLIRAHDATTGALLWAKLIDFPDHAGRAGAGNDCAKSVAIGGGYVIVVGNTDTDGIAYTPAKCPGARFSEVDSRFHVQIYRLADGHLVFQETVSHTIDSHAISTGEATSAAALRRSSVEVEFQVAGRLGVRAFTKAYRLTNP